MMESPTNRRLPKIGLVVFAVVLGLLGLFYFIAKSKAPLDLKKDSKLLSIGYWGNAFWFSDSKLGQLSSTDLLEIFDLKTLVTVSKGKLYKEYHLSRPKLNRRNSSYDGTWHLFEFYGSQLTINLGLYNSKTGEIRNFGSKGRFLSWEPHSFQFRTFEVDNQGNWLTMLWYIDGKRMSEFATPIDPLYGGIIGSQSDGRPIILSGMSPEKTTTVVYRYPIRSDQKTKTIEIDSQDMQKITNHMVEARSDIYVTCIESDAD